MNNIFRPSLIVVKQPGFIRNISISCARYKNFDDLVHPEGHEPNIPPYIEREGENATLKRARLVYQSRKRGMLENAVRSFD
ncbi:succinate dehydrogenase assembly factor 2, mitochondrial isoform X2 [Cephus cinctus]|uniref:Succinate dehydrogenase assembly factor 2, mitochondrial isoform X2 n=1 Tax=Cephus cinctus TaxID=211228 RepID=A0AAJ7C049_CEPCN|nr:succinate dehydrogenase assembly factor 2, mitochondrial isoform X2 [Cephus cinctus]